MEKKSEYFQRKNVHLFSIEQPNKTYSNCLENECPDQVVFVHHVDGGGLEKSLIFLCLLTCLPLDMIVKPLVPPLLDHIEHVQRSVGILWTLLRLRPWLSCPRPRRSGVVYSQNTITDDLDVHHCGFFCGINEQTTIIFLVHLLIIKNKYNMLVSLECLKCSHFRVLLYMNCSLFINQDLYMMSMYTTRLCQIVMCNVNAQDITDKEMSFKIWRMSRNIRYVVFH